MLCSGALSDMLLCMMPYSLASTQPGDGGRWPSAGERISMPPAVSILFEVEDLSQASPATVSRAGMIYLNVEDLGWQPFITSWLQTKTVRRFPHRPPSLTEPLSCARRSHVSVNPRAAAVVATVSRGQVCRHVREGM